MTRLATTLTLGRYSPLSNHSSIPMHLLHQTFSLQMTSPLSLQAKLMTSAASSLQCCLTLFHLCTSRSSFSVPNEKNISTLLLSGHPTTYYLDPIPYTLLQQITPTLTPAIKHIINTPLTTAIFPTTFCEKLHTSLSSFISSYNP